MSPNQAVEVENVTIENDKMPTELITCSTLKGSPVFRNIKVEDVTVRNSITGLEQTTLIGGHGIGPFSFSRIFMENCTLDGIWLFTNSLEESYQPVENYIFKLPGVFAIYNVDTSYRIEHVWVTKSHFNLLEFGGFLHDSSIEALLTLSVDNVTMQNITFPS